MLSQQGDAVARTMSMKDVPSRTAVLILLAVLVFLYTIRWILLPFVLPAVAAYICTPLLDWLAQRTRLPRLLFASAVFVILLAVVAGFAALGLPPLAQQVGTIMTDFGPTVENLFRSALGDRSVQFMGSSMNAAQLAQALTNWIRDWIGQAGISVQILAWSVAGVFGAFLAAVLLFYFLQGGRQLARGVLWLVPPAHRPLVELIWERLDPVLRRYFIGVVVVVAYAAAAAYVGLGLVLGIRHAFFLALLTGALEMLPVVGPAAAAIIAGLVAASQATGFGSIVAYAIYATALRLSIDQLLGPIVLGRAARLHPSLIIFCFLAGGLLFGIAGVIMAVPVALGIKITLATVYDEDVPGKRDGAHADQDDGPRLARRELHRRK